MISDQKKKDVYVCVRVRALLALVKLLAGVLGGEGRRGDGGGGETGSGLIDAPQRRPVAEIDDGKEARHPARDAQREAESQGEAERPKSEQSQVQHYGGDGGTHDGSSGV